jgi:hypothetical protein
MESSKVLLGVERVMIYCRTSAKLNWVPTDAEVRVVGSVGCEYDRDPSDCSPGKAHTHA